MQRVLVAGATGYLGKHVARALKERGAWVRALIRNPQQRSALLPWVDDFAVAQVTRPPTLCRVADGVDAVFSSIGITRQREGFTFEEVDYQGNVNLLTAASRQSVARFVYVSIFQGLELRGLAMVDAKERFVTALTESAIAHTIIRPTGFFSDIATFLAMARRGRVILFGDGTARINPISGHDLADECADAVMGGGSDVDLGGPEAYSYNDIAAMAFQIVRKPPRIWHVPDWSAEILARGARHLTPQRIGGPLEFVLAVTRRDMVAPRYGQQRLEGFLRSL